MVRRDRRELLSSPGSVLILALWALFFLASMTVAVGSHVSAALGAAARLRDRQSAREQAIAGVERAWGVIRSATNEEEFADNEAMFLDNNEIEGGSFTVFHLEVLDNGTVSTNYGVIHETRRLNLNKASQSQLSALLVARGGLSEPLAARTAAAIISARSTNTWLTPSVDGGYHPSTRSGVLRRSFQMPEELLLVPEVGSSEGLYSAIEPFVTVYGKGYYAGVAVGRDNGGRFALTIRFVVSGSSGTKVHWFEE